MRRKPRTDIKGYSAFPEEGYPTFSVVVPSAGRASLARTLASISSQVLPGDEILVLVNRAWDWGNSARQEGQERAKADYVLFCDDDDVFVPGAFAAMRSWAAANPGKIGLFRRKADAWPTQWQVPVLKPGNVQSSNMVVPNVAGKLAAWGVVSQDREKQRALDEQGQYWSDAMFVEQTAKLQGTEYEFVDIVTVHAEPVRNPLKLLRYRLALRTRLRRLVAR
jgi:glycosyltransferase involved in cell wall biosynthesis